MEQSNQKPLRILFLEDEDVLAKLYCKKLREAGYEVMLCKDAGELLANHEAFKADLAFLDHALHGDEQSGMDMIPILKKDNPNVKIVMLTNYSEFQVRDQAEKIGAKDYLLKINTSPAQLVDYVNRLFG